MPRRAALHRRHLSLRIRRAAIEPTGLIPTSTPRAMLADTRPARPPLDRGLTARLLRVFDRNPFYHAYRSGFVRLFANESAAPGSVVAAAVTMVGLVVYRATTDTEPAVAGGILFGTLTISSVIGACEGLVLGAKALSIERDRSTWPLLVVSGVRPSMLLRGKFASAFYALSGEWTLATLFWMVAALGWHPAVVLLALVQPTSIALGILCGLWVASQPQYGSTQRTGVTIVGLVGFMGVFAWVLSEALNHDSSGLFSQAHLLNPLDMVNNLAVGNSAQGVVEFCAQAALWGGIGLLLWNRAHAGVQRLLRGEQS